MRRRAKTHAPSWCSGCSSTSSTGRWPSSSGCWKTRTAGTSLASWTRPTKRQLLQRNCLFVGRVHDASEVPAVLVFQQPELLGHLPVLLVLEQPLHQLGAWVFALLLIRHQCGGARQQHARLDLH